VGRGNGTELIIRTEVRRTSGAVCGYGTELIIMKEKDDYCIGIAATVSDIFIFKQLLGRTTWTWIIWL
jgi:hypothetical protein